jgi:3-O-methylgallate 3,4-dioxygenase
MAKIVLGIGTSHGPMLSTPWKEWGQRVNFDKSKKDHYFRGKTYAFDELVELRKPDHFEREITEEKWKTRHAACQEAIEALSRKYYEVKPDVAIVVGNDQREMFVEDNFPAFAVYWGSSIHNGPRSPEQVKMLPPGVAISERGHAPPEDVDYPGLPALGRHLIDAMMDEGFDVASMSRLPNGSGYVNGIPHAFGFVYRRIMKDQVIPNVPVCLNTFYPPNQPRAARCYKFGKALAKAIANWDSDKTVAVFGSGGLSHFVIDEEVDRKVLKALADNDDKTLLSIPENRFQDGTSECKNWIPLAAIMDEMKFKMTLIDYVPCYRSVAGTGNAMAFAYWQPQG